MSYYDKHNERKNPEAVKKAILSYFLGGGQLRYKKLQDQFYKEWEQFHLNYDSNVEPKMINHITVLTN